MDQPWEFHLVDLWAVVIGLGVVLLLANAPALIEDGRRLLGTVRRRYFMSTAIAGDDLHNGVEVVHVPVSPTSTQAENGAGADDALADTNAVPCISRYLSDSELIVFLAVQRLPGGKYRLSANDIARLMGGKRADVLALVRAVREGPAQYPERTPEQLATRQRLGLDKP